MNKEREALEQTHSTNYWLHEVEMANIRGYKQGRESGLKEALAQPKQQESVTNNRIQELAEQAGLLGPSSRVGNAHEATKKFAELIIAECGLIVDELAGGQMGGAGSYDLNKHFGVTE